MNRLVGGPVRLDEPPAEPGTVSARALYAATADPEANYTSTEAADALRLELADWTGDGHQDQAARDLTAQDLSAEDLTAQEQRAAAWAAGERERVGALFETTAFETLFVQRAVLGVAPLALVAGAWIQWINSPANCHDDVALAALTLYASDMHVGGPGPSRGQAFLALLERLQLADYAWPAVRLVHDRRVPDCSFRLPAVLLAISRRPDEFLPELLGADLCLRNVGLLPALGAVRLPDGVHPDWTALDPSTPLDDGLPGGLTQCRWTVEQFSSRASADDRRRLLAGFRWALGSLQAWSDTLRHQLAHVHPEQEMAELLRLRVREGALYHHGFTLDGRSLGSWMEASSADPLPLMDALASSSSVAPGSADRSPLTTDLVSETGPMFRVFDEDDLAVIRRWIDSLPATPARRAAPGPLGPPLPDLGPATLARSDDDGHPPGSVREAYHRLQRRSTSPALARWATSYVHGWLARSRYRLDADDRQLPRRWTPDGLRPWLLDQHDRHAEQFVTDTDAPEVSRQALVESTVQTAPLVLLDGSLLHGFTDYQQVATDIGRLLFRTYWDELGDCRPELNHPRIYRQLLEEMDVDLPPTASWAFASSDRLGDRSFELPVYWLSIGRSPRTFTPEILGLNLAMELSGVGGSYRSARLALQRHGFSTRFVDIHNTIDNVAAGHTAWAADAVDTFIATIGDTHGHGAQVDAWERVRVGFVSLDPPSGRRHRSAQRRAQRRAFRSNRPPQSGRRASLR
jgi:heme oxygenase-like protein